MEPNGTKSEDGARSKKYLLGVIVIAAGFLLLLSNIGLLPYDLKHVLLSWQMLLIGIGIVSLFSSESRTPGTILILIGGIFILPRIFDLHFNVWHVFWPVILIGLGILIYGIAYFFVHEVFIHQRINWLRNTNSPYFLGIRKAHKIHHKHLGKEDGECFGMLWVPLKYFREARKTLAQQPKR